MTKKVIIKFFFIIIYLIILSFCQTNQQVIKNTSVSTNTLKNTSPSINNIKISDVIKKIDGNQIVPQQYRKIYIMPIKQFYRNKIKYTISMSLLKEAFLNQILSNNYDFIIVNKKNSAKLLLYISVVEYNEIPIKYDEIKNVEAYKIYIAINIKLDINPRIKKETLILNKLIEYQDTYNAKIFPYESKYSFNKRVLKSLSKRILLTLYTGWYTEDKNKDKIGKNLQEDKVLECYNNFYCKEKNN